MTDNRKLTGYEKADLVQTAGNTMMALGCAMIVGLFLLFCLIFVIGALFQ